MNANKWLYVIIAVLVTPFCLYVGIVEGFINRRIGLGGKGGPSSFVVGKDAVIVGAGYVFIAGLTLWGCYQKFMDED